MKRARKPGIARTAAGRAAKSAAGAANLSNYLATVGAGSQRRLHGISALVKDGTPLPNSKVVKRADKLVRDVTRELGTMNARQKSLIESLRLAMRVIVLANDYFEREGLFDKRGRPHSLLPIANAYMATSRSILAKLGLEDVALPDAAPTIADIAKEIESGGNVQ